MKRILSFLLTMLMLLSLMPVSTMAAELPESEQFKEVKPAYTNISDLEDLHFSGSLRNALYATVDNTTASASGFSRHTRDSEYTPTTPLEITQQPDNATALRGDWVYVTVKARGDGLKYQWWYKDPGMEGYMKTEEVDNIYDVVMSSYNDRRVIYCEITDQYGNSKRSRSVTLRIGYSNYADITEQPQDIAVPAGTTATVSVTAKGDGLSYQWYYKDKGSTSFAASGNETASYSVTMSDAVDGRQVYCVVSDHYAHSETSKTVVLSQNAYLGITEQPQDVTVPAGEMARITVKAEGEGLKYQWYWRNAGDSNFLASDQTTDTYEITMASFCDGRQVYCKITDKYGSSVTSDIATMHMGCSTPATPLEITQQPQNVTVPVGSTATVFVEATGDGLEYRWYAKDVEDSEFYPTSNKTATYSVTMWDFVAGRQLFCKITDKYGNSVNTDTVILNMSATLAITKQPTSVTVPNGSTATVYVQAAEASGGKLSYQWYYKNANSSSFAKSSTTISTYSVVMSDSVAGRQVYCEVSDNYGNSVSSNIVTLNMAASLAITQQPKSVTVYNGETAKVTIQATGEGLQYQWFVKMPTSSSYQKGSQTGTTYSVKMTDARAGMKVCCKVTDKYGNSITSGVATLNQGTTLAITQQPKSVTVYNGETAKVTVKAAGDGLQYQWYVKMPTSSSYQKSSQTGTAYAVTMNDSRNGMKVCCKITDKYGRSVTSNAVTLSKNTALAITQQPKSVSVASGAAAKVTVKAVGEGLTYQWFVKMPTSSSYVKGSQTGTTYSVTMNDSRNGMKVCCKITDKYGKSVTSEVATLKQVTALTITQQPRSVTVAPGEAAKATVKASGEGLTYQWYVKMPTSSSYSKSSQTGTTYSVAMNESRNGMMIFCKVTDKYSNSINSSIVTLKMATPLAITQQPKSVAVAIGSTARVTVKAVGDGLTYQWFYKNAGGTDFLTSSQTTATYSVKMTESCVGRQLCCMITDQYGNILISNTVTLKRG